MYRIIFEDEKGNREKLAIAEKIEIAKFLANKISHEYCKHNYKNCRLYIEKFGIAIVEYNTYYR